MNKILANQATPFNFILFAITCVIVIIFLFLVGGNRVIREEISSFIWSQPRYGIAMSSYNPFIRNDKVENDQLVNDVDFITYIVSSGHGTALRLIAEPRVPGLAGWYIVIRETGDIRSAETLGRCFRTIVYCQLPEYKLDIGSSNIDDQDLRAREFGENRAGSSRTTTILEEMDVRNPVKVMAKLQKPDVLSIAPIASDNNCFEYEILLKNLSLIGPESIVGKAMTLESNIFDTVSLVDGQKSYTPTRSIYSAGVIGLSSAKQSGISMKAIKEIIAEKNEKKQDKKE